MSAAFFRGTQLEQNVKFKDKDKQLKKEWQWPKEFDEPVDLSKIQLDVIKQWVEKRITELMGIEDDVVFTYAQNQLDDAFSKESSANGGLSLQQLDPKQMQINLTGFMEEKTPQFMKELWALLLSAQKEPSGIPEQLIKEKMQEKEMKEQMFQRAKEQLEKIKSLQKDQERRPRSPSFSDGKGYEREENKDRHQNDNFSRHTHRRKRSQSSSRSRDRRSDRYERHSRKHQKSSHRRHYRQDKRRNDSEDSKSAESDRSRQQRHRGSSPSRKPHSDRHKSRRDDPNRRRDRKHHKHSSRRDSRSSSGDYRRSSKRSRSPRR